jgi:signal transduction histidine kinase
VELIGYWDAARLEQVVTNLIDNAIKYSPPGNPIEVGLIGRSTSVLLLVRDRGIGIPKEQIAKLFQAFYRVDSPPHQCVPGLGLGLHIAQEIVRLHGGSIGVDSRPGQGSLFSVELPRQPADGAGPADPAGLSGPGGRDMLGSHDDGRGPGEGADGPLSGLAVVEGTESGGRGA